MASKKLTKGNGWSFEPAGGGKSSPEPVTLPPELQKVTIRMEKRGKGKEVTVVTGFLLADVDRKELAAILRRTCGAGGTDNREEIVVQGDHRPKLTEHLSRLGWRVR